MIRAGSLSNARRLEQYIQDPERDGDEELAKRFGSQGFTRAICGCSVATPDVTEQG